MSWSYSWNPASSERDTVRFLVGDTDTNDQKVANEEITYALSVWSTVELAAALVLYSLAAKFSSSVSTSFGGVSTSCSDVAKAYAERASALDPMGLVTSRGSHVLPSFGGRSVGEKESLNSDTDAVQPSFYRGMDDYPGGPGDGGLWDPYRRA